MLPILSSKETQQILSGSLSSLGRSILSWIPNTWSPCWSLSPLLCSLIGTTGWGMRMSMQRSLFLHSWPNVPLKVIQQKGKQGSSWQRWRFPSILKVLILDIQMLYFPIISTKSWRTWSCRARLSWSTRWFCAFFRKYFLVLIIIIQDNDHALVSVTLFQKVVDEFKTKVEI